MKKLACMTLIFMVSLSYAQEGRQSKQKMNAYSPEERAQLQTKQMTLDLDLTEAQQKQVQEINLKNAQERQAKYDARESASKTSEKEKPSNEERLKMKNEQLDRQIEMKNKMKSILNTEQFEKWEKISDERREKQKKQMHQKKKMQPSE